ncbi:MAG: oligosaccharide repeat unit polymerase [Agathobacter sp.]|nr:oligosaccharide repeat unit polymerase [Agathobacter sp.]
MINKIDKYFNVKHCIFTFIGVLAIIIGGIINPYQHFLTGLLLIIAAFALYFANVFVVANKNWLDIRGVFAGVWLATIGLAALRLTDYQEQWLLKTWILLAVAYFMFQLGASFGINMGVKIYDIKEAIASKLNLKKAGFYVKENRLFLICIIVTALGLTCFILNVAIKGFIPAFSNDLYAYINFYTKFHLFAVAATAISGLCYYCIRTQPIALWKKIVLWVCIFYLVILFPILVVSRGVFIIAALPLAVTIFYLNKRKLYVFIFCLVIIGGVYLLTSNLRGYTDEQLGSLFQPSDIVIGGLDTEDTEIPGESESTTEDEDDSQGNHSQVITFTLPPKAAFLYGYLTVSHDNFNEAIEHTEGYTWGTRQLEAFNVILRIPAITETIAEGEFYMVRPYLNTVNMMGLFYYDFHEIGIVICSFLWAVLFGLAQGYYEKSKSIFSLLIHGFSMNAVALSFFSSWINSFELWMFCGVILIISIVASISFKHRRTIDGKA